MKKSLLSTLMLAALAPYAGLAAESAETVELSPFTITASSDDGWSGTDTLMASRTKQALKDVPFSIDAITADFLTDLDLGLADDAARFVAGVHAEFQMDNDNDQASVSFRGMTQRYNLSRNYFRSQTPSDNYNVERIDFGKGSNSLVFGDTEPGGQGSVQTKRAQFRNFGRTFLQYTSADAYRMELDINRKLTDTLAVRVNLVDRDLRTYQDFSKYKLKAGHVALTWRPFKTTEIRLEVEQGDFKNTRGFNGIRVRERSARSLAFANNFWYVTSDGAIIDTRTLPAADRAAANNPTGGAVSLLEGSSVDVTMVNAAGVPVGTKRIDGFPDNTNIRGTFDLFARPYNTHTITIEQRLGKLGIEFAYNFQNQTSNRNDGTFATAISVDVNGRPYTDVNSINRKYIGDEVDAFRLAAVLPWQPFKWMRQTLVGALEYSETSRDQYRIRLSNFAGIDNGSQQILTNAQQIRYRAYLDDPRFYSEAFYEQFLPENLPQTSTFRADWFSYDTSDTYFERKAAASFAATGNYFNDRLHSVFGIRHDTSVTYDYVVGRQRLDAIGGQLPAPRPRRAAPGDFLSNPTLDIARTTGSAGLTYSFTPGLNLYGSWGSSFRSQSDLTFDKERVGPITGVTKEIGLKGDFLNRRLIVSVGVFDIERQNVAYTWTPNDLTSAELRELFNPNNLPDTDPAYRVFAEQPVNVVRSTEFSRGFDGTLLYRPFTGLQFRVTLAKIALETTPEFGAFRKLLDEAIARGEENPALITDAQLMLDSSDHAGKPTGPRGSPWSGSWAVDYSFARDFAPALRGVRFGINGYWRQDYLLGIRDDVEYRGGATHIVGAYLSRDQKIWGRDVRIRLGAKNLFDLENGDDPRATGIVNRLDNTVSYGYSYIMPAQYDLSIAVKF